ncbi:hypothetical protein [Phytomonospora endophytica]|uniref:Drug/metabolite transporter (DMT)-like permease n=1 Tax=Phytomonospora endophytica TaxID=714109 RepID=A0A841FVK0_9ACTN|nr:hypothetical protein [Phytomonospora endophytica]MBB6038793.1 drug/metabolite transporter (DMT)-like permease [Phytomonospora endophytica]GIG68411.1 hypothetical protein Pen01_47060 [Phytomonospora endophytica]
MFVLLLLGKLSPRRRVVSGVTCALAGILWIAVSAVAAPGLLVHGVVLAAVGAILWISGAVARRRARVTTVEYAGER